MMTDPERIPVIIGVGQINDRPDDPDQGLDPAGLMVAALQRAEVDGGGDLLAALDSLAIVDQISFRHLGKLCDPVAAGIGAKPAINYQSEAPHGDTPIRLLNEAANRIGAGEVRLAAVVGAEALRTAAGLAAKTKGDASYNAVRAASRAYEPGYAQLHGLIAPVDCYPLYENAGRATYGQSLAEAQGESGQIWSLFSQVAATNDREIDVAIRDGEIKNIKALNILWTSQTIPTFPLAYRKDLPQSLQKALREAVLSFNDKKALTRIGLKSFAPATDDEYDPIRKLEQAKSL